VTNGLCRVAPRLHARRRHSVVHHANVSRRGPKNNRVYGQLFRPKPAKQKGRPQVIVLAQWNARGKNKQDVCRWLARLRDYRDQDEPSATTTAARFRGIPRRSPHQSECRLDAASESPVGWSDVRHTLQWLDQQATRAGNSGHKHRLLHRVHHHVP